MKELKDMIYFLTMVLVLCIGEMHSRRGIIKHEMGKMGFFGLGWVMALNPWVTPAMSTIPVELSAGITMIGFIMICVKYPTYDGHAYPKPR